jgi:tripartite-type tricarboxylate transporter receptor subunit TctC
VGLLAPAKTPNAVVATLAEAVAAILGDSEFTAAMSKQGAEPLRGSPDEFGKLITSEIPRWAAVVEAIGLKLDN